MDVTIRNLSKAFRGTPVLRDLSLDIRDGELIALLGPSGSGKTTLLRLIAGLEFPSHGSILFGGEDAFAKTVQERHIGFVFQHYALFRHMTVFDNIAFGLRVRPRGLRPGREEIAAKVRELLTLVQLEGLDARYPAQLSGGQRQRVALARALAIDPSILLLDEPFGALDAQVRKDLRRWLRDLHDKTRHTTVFVTHDQEEALELADRVVIIHDGQIAQVGTPDEVYNEPATPFVYGFLGAVNVLPVEVRDGHVVLDGYETILPAARPHGLEGAANLYVRAHDLELGDDRARSIPGVVRTSRRLAGLIRLEVEIPGGHGPLSVELPEAAVDGRLRLAPGTRVLLCPRRYGVFPRGGEPGESNGWITAEPRLAAVS
ncbi:sulfate/molybdate ABC transporter ATP-binding protein [Pedomonas mirosovicensis]|uniref:sulfate/molybdate ABC transporter ATP-binding protein n=1 Tax=Pedomonas mirosovicensis TaxID=2908641 RepID=UPI002167B6F0|nr:sulfate/molybdate ABC transporter ATP-binding protein [Pedomonas mirosovicensis]MCH8686091.1 sulfate/molybdate ABC transporter ATP-binding protein [Pedomonas mirosovicensis]